jgi:hypothetical protein
MTEREKTEERAKDRADKKTPNRQDPDEKSESDTPIQEIKPVKEKIGEGHDNLRKRGEWYQRRTGGSR